MTCGATSATPGGTSTGRTTAAARATESVVAHARLAVAALESHPHASGGCRGNEEGQRRQAARHRL
ncbi:MAG: hypothetical protein MZW92_49985 [Comamonadaceae bacterium]|nr:hypothetical protein [Comamonadaceae bacterium]